MLKRMKAAGKALTDVVTAGVKLTASYAHPLAQTARAGAALASGYAGALNDGLKEEWRSYGKTGQRVVVAGSIAVSLGLALTLSLSDPVCPAHPLIGVGNPEFRCPAPVPAAQPK